MAFCPKCGAQIADGSPFCPACGIALNAAAPQPNPNPAPQPNPAPNPQQGPVPTPPPMPQQGMPVPPPMPPQPYPPMPSPSDHTAEFDPEDISQNKVTSMAPYVLGILGLILAFLAAPQSPYAAFHCRQALKIEIVSTLLLIVSGVLVWTFIVPILGMICVAILFVVRIICFFQVCAGKAKEAPIVGSLPFLK